MIRINSHPSMFIAFSPGHKVANQVDNMHRLADLDRNVAISSL